MLQHDAVVHTIEPRHGHDVELFDDDAVTGGHRADDGAIAFAHAIAGCENGGIESRRRPGIARENGARRRGSLTVGSAARQGWTVRQERDKGSTQLTLWRPTDGKEEMFSLSISGPRAVSIATVRGGVRDPDEWPPLRPSRSDWGT